MSEEQQNHEIVMIFAEYLHPLRETLVEMLNDHFSHQTERRGCGYTQATRLIAEYVNVKRDAKEFDDLAIFDKYDTSNLKIILHEATSYGLQLETWRHLDIHPQVQAFLQKGEQSGSAFYQALQKEVHFQKTLRTLKQYAKREESLLIFDFIEDIILPKSADELGLTDVHHLMDKPKVGSCTMAENFFLKIAHHKLLRKGEINIFVDKNNQPLIMEKMNMGDNHSCVSLAPLIMHGIRIPMGSLFSVAYDVEKLHCTKNKKLNGNLIPIGDVDGFWFLRITTLAVSPEVRERAFTTHFKQQIQNGLFNPEGTLIQQLVTVAKEQL